jgi:hypothetical protein
VAFALPAGTFPFFSSPEAAQNAKLPFHRFLLHTNNNSPPEAHHHSCAGTILKHMALCVDNGISYDLTEDAASCALKCLQRAPNPLCSISIVVLVDKHSKRTILDVAPGFASIRTLDLDGVLPITSPLRLNSYHLSAQVCDAFFITIEM